jgi:hypothetical protein
MQSFQVRLQSMLDEYMIVRQEKELEKKRQRVLCPCLTFLCIAEAISFACLVICCNCRIIRSSRISSKLSRKHSTDQNQVHPNLKVQRRRLETPWVVQTEGCLLVEPQCNHQKRTCCIPRLLVLPRRLKIWVYLLVSSFTIQLLLCFFLFSPF